MQVLSKQLAESIGRAEENGNLSIPVRIDAASAALLAAEKGAE